MKTSTIIGIIAIIIIAAGAYMLWGGNTPTASDNEEGTTSGMRAEENAVVVMEQRPGSTITASSVFLAAPGFLVIHEDSNGAPGAILGASVLLRAGENSQIEVNLSRATRDGERLHAMLHSDVDANGSFTASTDTPVQSRLGGPVSGWFDISAGASETLPEVSI